MKIFIYSAGILCLCASTTGAMAQETTESKPAIKAQKFEIGLQAGVQQSFRSFSPSRSMFNIDVANPMSVSQGVFARYYLGKHFAVESGINFSTSGMRSDRGPAILDASFGTLHRRVNTKSFEVPLQVQYHLLSKESRLRPYFGLGLSHIIREEAYQYVFTDNNGLVRPSTYTDRYRTAAANFTQGLTWQISNKWQLNQSFSYQRELRDNRNNIGFRLGVGYTIK